MSAPGTVHLVGAGPGDPALITMRGAELLSRADVVAYDRLVDPAVLRLAPQARLEFVGRAPGDPDTQDRVNELLVAEARAGRRVVRLKGGDPFVFGRGGEEIEALAAAGIPYEVVPGVTSAVAAAAAAGVPLTHRNHSSWIAIATGHETDRQTSRLDWDALAHAGTAVFLMGLTRLPEIASRLIEAGRDPSTPAVVVQAASLPAQRVVASVLEHVADDAAQAGLRSPATLIVGEVAALATKLDWSARLPLLGRTVLVVRPGEDLPRLLRDRGARPVVVPVIRVAPPADEAPLRAAVEELASGRFGWALFTSQNAVDAVWERLRSAGLDARALARVAVGVVGPATADRLRNAGIEPDLVATGGSGASLAAELGRPEKGSRGRVRRVFYPRSDVAESGVLATLTRAGWRVTAPDAYRTLTDVSAADAGRVAIADGVDAVVFTSGSSARAFAELWGRPPEGVVVCCIGPQAARVAGEAGIPVHATASDHTLGGLVAALEEAVRG